MDFTLKQYKALLQALLHKGFPFQTYASYSGIVESKELIADSQQSKVLVLRHDVDKMPQNSLRFAKIQADLGIQATYYFRIVPESWDEDIIKEIAALGHEVGYHYETMDEVSSKFKVQRFGFAQRKSSKLKRSGSPVSTGLKKGEGKISEDQLIDLAYEEFCENLEAFRKIVDVKTISMHGSPLSSFDNRAIWKKYDYKKLGLIAEPYFDLDFNKTFYITDTGRRWDGDKFNVRDKPMAARSKEQGARSQEVVSNPEFLKLHFHSTNDLIAVIEKGDFPNQAMFNFHPQRWNDSLFPWLKELLWQNVKNQIKRILVIKSNLA